VKGSVDKLNNDLTEAQKLKKATLANIGKLAQLVDKGDYAAPEQLLRVAYEATRQVAISCKLKPHLFEPLARNELSWPVEHSLHDDWMKANNVLLGKLNLAADTGINITGNGRRFSFETPANKIAIELHFLARALSHKAMDWESVEWIKYWWTAVPWAAAPSAGNPFKDDPHYFRALEKWGQKGPGRSLPPLSKNTAEQWKKAVPDLFRLVYGSDFDTHAHLKRLRESLLLNENHPGRVEGAAEIRKRMLQAVLQAFGTIAACTKQDTK